MTKRKVNPIPGLAAAAALVAALPAQVGARSTSDLTLISSEVKSKACDGSCVAILRTESQWFLQVRDPATGELFKLVPLDLAADATVGAPTGTMVSAWRGADTKRDGHGGDASTPSIPKPPSGGTGTVLETSPFSDSTGTGELQMTYVFVSHRLQDVILQKIPFGQVDK